MYSSILNTEWDSNLTLTFRCCVSRTAIKLTNEGVINSVIDICIFQVIITVFKDFSLENFYIKFQDLPYFSRICTNPVYQWRLDWIRSSSVTLQSRFTLWNFISHHRKVRSAAESQGISLQWVSRIHTVRKCAVNHITIILNKSMDTSQRPVVCSFTPSSSRIIGKGWVFTQ